VGLSAVQATSFGVARASRIINCGVQAGLGVGSMEGLVVGSPVGLCIFFVFDLFSQVGMVIASEKDD
jgi:hypothetical protein